MRVDIKTSGLDLMGGLRDHAQMRLEFSLDWARQDVRGVSINLSDINGILLWGVFASIIVRFLSRQWGFCADQGGAILPGRQNMIAALERLNSLHPQSLPAKMATFGIADGGGVSLKRLFMTHPPLEEHIEALRQQAQ